MKKQYISPATMVQNIQLTQMIASSTLSSLGFGDTLDDASGADSRIYRNSLWDDDEDYDELLGF